MAELSNIQSENILRGNQSVADILGISVVAVSNMVSRGDLNFKRVGKHNFFDKTNLFADKLKKSNRK